MKKQTKVVIFVVTVLLILTVIGGMWYFISENNKNTERQERKNIEQNYAAVVEVTKETKLYQKREEEYEEIGTAYPGMTFFLKEKEKKHLTKYYSIAESDLYIFYEDVKPGTKAKSVEPYLPFSESVVVKANKRYFDKKKTMLSFSKETSYPLVKKLENSYIVSLFGSLLEVSKDVVKEVNSSSEEIPAVKNIPVFQFSSLKESCKTGKECVTYQQIEKIFEWAKEKKLVSIQSRHLKEWIEKKVLLPENAILFLYDSETKGETIEKLETKYQLWFSSNEEDLKFSFENKRVNSETTLEKIPMYSVTSDTNMARIEEMFQGIEPIVEEIEDQGIAVLNYHFFYDKEGGEKCNESICLDIKNFKEQLEYLKDQGYKTVKMQEFVDWMNGKISLPKKSVLLTIDDGAMGTYNHLLRILEEYDMYATLFLISGWWPLERYQSTHLEIQSHGHDLHHNDYCNSDKKCGVKTGLLSEEELLSDLKLSIETIKTSLAFCYPFYSYSNSIMSTVKKAGFQVAFVGGNKKAKKNSLRYAVPRYVIYKDTSLAQFKRMVGN